ncbi:MAG TPA: DUF2269 family protein [Pseudogracilibacillus sp.]|nr:DUF2269 family protein [Pseudogracilibacillus sp.]
MGLYDILLFIHVFSAILGLGPGFVMIYVVTKATTMTELRHAYVIRNRIHIFVMVGGTLLLLTGIGMGLLRPALFQMIWYDASLVLFLLALAAGPVVLSPLSKPIKTLLYNYPEGEEVIPESYEKLANQLFLYERITNIIFIVIIALMILKPF